MRLGPAATSSMHPCKSVSLQPPNVSARGSKATTWIVRLVTTVAAIAFLLARAHIQLRNQRATRADSLRVACAHPPCSILNLTGVIYAVIDSIWLVGGECTNGHFQRLRLGEPGSICCLLLTSTSANTNTPTRRTMSTESAQRFPRSEEHTSELQSPYDLVCRLLL